jgi:hypothetical protein
MPEAATAEFWRDLKPIAKVFQPDAQPEVPIGDAPTADERSCPLHRHESSSATASRSRPFRPIASGKNGRFRGSGCPVTAAWRSR